MSGALRWLVRPDRRCCHAFDPDDVAADEHRHQSVTTRCGAVVQYRAAHVRDAPGEHTPCPHCLAAVARAVS